MLRRQDSNLDQRIQSPLCCLYTTAEWAQKWPGASLPGIGSRLRPGLRQMPIFQTYGVVSYGSVGKPYRSPMEDTAMTTTDDAPRTEPSPPPEATDELPSGTLGGEEQTLGERITIGVFVAVPFPALLAAIPVAWIGGWLTWLDAVLALVMYLISGHGVTVGFHRFFTHRSFKANRGVKCGLAI